MKTAIITGVTGQDGSYLAELLLDKGYQVHGIARLASTNNCARIHHLLGKPDFKLHAGDVRDFDSISRAVDVIDPDEFYNLAALSHVGVSFENPHTTAEATGVGALNCLEALRRHNNGCRFYQASSSEMFGSSPPPQNESTPFHPRSPYGCAKVFAYHATVNYRESYGMHASNGILFNHESPRRGSQFVTRKITLGLNRIAWAMRNGQRWEPIKLGNLDAMRDWGHAKDYVRAMWMMLQAPDSDNYVVATGQMWAVSDFFWEAFYCSGLPGKPESYFQIDPGLIRPAEVVALQGDYSKIERVLGWQPECDFNSLVREMMEADAVN